MVGGKIKEKEKEIHGRNRRNGGAHLFGMSSIVSADGDDLSAHLQELMGSRTRRRHCLQITLLNQKNSFLGWSPKLLYE